MSLVLMVMLAELSNLLMFGKQQKYHECFSKLHAFCNYSALSFLGNKT